MKGFSNGGAPDNTYVNGGVFTAEHEENNERVEVILVLTAGSIYCEFKVVFSKPVWMYKK